MKIHELKAFLEGTPTAEAKPTKPEASIATWAAEAKPTEPTEPTERQMVRRAKLEMRGGVHNKEYHLEMYEEKDASSGDVTYTLTAKWGRIGYALQSQDKVKGQVGIGHCTSRFVDLLSEKVRKGYKVVDRWER